MTVVNRIQVESSLHELLYIRVDDFNRASALDSHKIRDCGIFGKLSDLTIRHSLALGTPLARPTSRIAARRAPLLSSALNLLPPIPAMAFPPLATVRGFMYGTTSKYAMQRS
jgi:hypothetical protein